MTKRPIFEFISNKIHPDNALVIFPLPDDYSFGILQSGIHWDWFTARCSTLKGDFRYTSSTVFSSFPFPQSPTLLKVKRVAEAAVKLRQLRRKIMDDNQWNLRELYRVLEMPGDSTIRQAHEDLDVSVRAAYGMKAKDNPLEFLLELNFLISQKEANDTLGVSPGLPPVVKKTSDFITHDCIEIPTLSSV